MALITKLLTLIGLCLLLNVQAQDTIPLYSDALAKQKAIFRPAIGIDVYQAVWVLNSVLNRDSPATYAYPLSVTFYLPLSSTVAQQRSLYLNAGYVAYGGTSQRNIYQKGGSMHLRAGIEQTRGRVILGYGGLLTGWSGQGSFYFSGPTFGNYQESIRRLGGLAVGGEGHVGLVIPVSSHLSLRTILRSSLLYRLTTTSPFELYAPHLSGTDWQTNRELGLGISLQANLVYRL